MSARGEGLQGRKVTVKLLDGTRFVDTFKDNTSRHVIFDERGRIPRDSIKKIVRFIDRPYRWKMPRDTNQFDAAQAKEFPNLCPYRNWVNTDPSYSGRNGFLTGFQGGHWENCGHVLDENGNCEEHGKVRLNPHEREDEEKKKQEPSLRYDPPRRRAGGRTRPRRAYNFR